ncbi:MAG TPA: hypothetical protein VMT29_22235, partial [Steroidobacteraceae bacterium]|nr:hypothetical protein [Steroidobacteraceae bacterium]
MTSNVTELYRGRSLWACVDGDGVVTLHLDRVGESVNKLDSLAVRELAAACAAIAVSPGARGLLVISDKPAFVVGADIFEFTSTFA